MTKKTKKNPKGAGRKPVPYKSKQVFIPVDLIPEVLLMKQRYIESLKQ